MMNSVLSEHCSSTGRLKSLPTSDEVGNWDADFRPGLKLASGSPEPVQMNSAKALPSSYYIFLIFLN